MEGRKLVRVRRQDSGALGSPSAGESLTPQPSVTTPASPFSKTISVPLIAGIIIVAIITIGLIVLLWRWRLRMKQMRRSSRSMHSSLQKYGAGRGIASTDSTQKVEIHGSFFEEDEVEPRRKSILTFKVAGKSSTPKSPTSTKGQKKSQSGWFNDGSPSALKISRTDSYLNAKVDDSRYFKVQRLPDSVPSKGISGPLHIVNGPAEPWSPVLPSPATTLTSMMASRPVERTPQLPPPVAFPAALKQSQPNQCEPNQSLSAKVGSSSASALSSDGSVYSMSSADRSSPVIPPPAVTQKHQAPRQNHYRNNPSTPPLPPSTTTLTYSSAYGHEGERPGSAGREQPANLSRLMTVVVRFNPTMPDELLLHEGDTVRVIEEYKDGWCLVQQVGRIDSPKGVVPAVCLQERRRIVPVPISPVRGPTHKTSNASIGSVNQRR